MKPLFVVVCAVLVSCSSPQADRERVGLDQPNDAGAELARPAALRLEHVAVLPSRVTPSPATIVHPELVVSNSELSLISATLAKAVEKREPVSPDDSFATGSRIYAHLVINNPERTETQVTVTWERTDGGRSRAPFPLTVRPLPRFRTWAYMTAPSTPGEWVCVVRSGGDNHELARLPFRVVRAEGTALTL